MTPRRILIAAAFLASASAIAQEASNGSVKFRVKLFDASQGQVPGGGSNGGTEDPTSALTVTPAGNPNQTVNRPIADSGVSASGGTPPYTYTISSSTDPEIQVDHSTGAIIGYPSTPGQHTVGVVATDSSTPPKVSVPAMTTFEVAHPIAVTIPAPAAGTRDAPYTTPLLASGGVGPYTYTLESGVLPTGTRIVGAAIAGTPTVLGTYPNIVIRATDSQGRTEVSSPISMVVNGPGSVDRPIDAVSGYGYGAWYSHAASAAERVDRLYDFKGASYSSQSTGDTTYVRIGAATKSDQVLTLTWAEDQPIDCVFHISRGETGWSGSSSGIRIELLDAGQMVLQNIGSVYPQYAQFGGATNRTNTQRTNVRHVRLTRNGGDWGNTSTVMLFALRAGKWNGSACITAD